MKCSLRPEWLRQKKMAAITCSCGCHGGATVVHGASDDRPDDQAGLLEASMAEYERDLERALRERDEATANHARLVVERADANRRAGDAHARAAREEQATLAALAELDEARAERKDALILVANRDRLIDAANAEIRRLREALSLAEVEVALERSWCRACRTEGRGDHRGRDVHPHDARCILAGGVR